MTPTAHSFKDCVAFSMIEPWRKFKFMVYNTNFDKNNRNFAIIINIFYSLISTGKCHLLSNSRLATLVSKG